MTLFPIDKEKRIWIESNRIESVGEVWREKGAGPELEYTGITLHSGQMYESPFTVEQLRNLIAQYQPIVSWALPVSDFPPSVT